VEIGMPFETSATSSEVVALRARVQELEAALGLSNGNLGAIFHLPSSQARLLGLLLETQTVTPEMIQERLRIVTNAKMGIHRLRAYLKAWSSREGVEPIEIFGRRTLGWWLDDATKQRIRALITAQVTPPEQAPPLAQAS
jgi:hypothetical protein